MENINTTHKYTTPEVRALAARAIDLLRLDKETEFFQITEELLKNKTSFYKLYIYGTELGKSAITDPDKYLVVLDKLFKKDVDYGSNWDHFRSSPFWTEDKIRAMVLGSRMSIIATGLSELGKHHPDKIIPIIKNYLVEGDGWYICDGLAIPLGNILKNHYNDTLPILKNWAKEENRWLRRGATVSILELIKSRDTHIIDSLQILDLMMKDQDKYVKKGVSWMLRELSKRYKKYTIEFITRHQDDFNKHTVWIIKNGIKKLSRQEQEQILDGLIIKK